MKNIRIAKFGGTSLSDTSCIQQAAKVVQDTGANLVVVSAVGGVTNALISLADRAATDPFETCMKEVEALGEQHLAIAKELRCSREEHLQITELIEEARVLITGMNMLSEVSQRSRDRFLSIGEKLSSLLMLAALRSKKLNAIKVNAPNILVTDANFGQAEPDLEELKLRAENHIKPSLLAGHVVVTQGFIGATPDGTPTTLGRGGSDYSAALLAEALQAEQLDIWTDVPGILETDPRIVPESQSVSELTFDEAAELATFGAKVLHPATLYPAIRGNIPVFVASTMSPEKGGTWIRANVPDAPIVRAIAVRKEQILITAKSFRMLQAHGFLAELFAILANHRISIDLVTTSEVSVAITVDNPTKLTEEVISELKQIAQIEMKQNLALVALVGNRLTSTSGIANSVFSIIKQYNIRFICHGASDRNLCFLVKEKDVNEIVTLLYGHFLKLSRRLA